MPPASPYSRRAGDTDNLFAMDSLAKHEHASDLEFSAGSESCRSKMLAEYEAKTGKSKQKRPLSRIPLWYFLFEVLHVEKYQSWITWENKEGLVFTIRKPKEIANLWGQIKKKERMTYAKLARGIRYYYGKGVIEKASGKRFSYRFIVSKKTKSVLVGSTSAEHGSDRDPPTAKGSRRHDRSGHVAADTYASRTADGLLSPAAHAQQSADVVPESRDRCSSSDSNEMAGSCVSSGESTSGEDESISELDLFDYDRLLREVLMDKEYDGNEDEGSCHASNFECDLLADDVDMSESNFNGMTISTTGELMRLDTADVSPSVIETKKVVASLGIAAAGNRHPSWRPEKSTFFSVKDSSQPCGDSNVSYFDGVNVSSNHSFIQIPVVSVSSSRSLAGSFQSPTPEHLLEMATSRRPSLDFNEAVASGFLRMTRNELAQEYDPLLFENIFTDNAL